MHTSQASMSYRDGFVPFTAAPDAPLAAYGERPLREIPFTEDLGSGEQGFCVYGQLIYDLSQEQTRVPPRREVLLRLLTGQGVALAPASFLPRLIHGRMNAHIDLWVLRRALEYLAREAAAAERININICQQTIQNFKPFYDSLCTKMSLYSVSPERLCLEISERDAFENVVAVSNIAARLKDRGIKTVLDSFGNGAYSFLMLRRLALDAVKIDRNLVRTATHDRHDENVIHQIVDIAGQLGVGVIAAGVESKRILDRVRALRIRAAQGYALAMPERLI